MSDLVAPPSGRMGSVGSLLVRSLPSPAAPGAKRRSFARRRDRKGFWFVLPFLIAFALFMLVPIGYAVYESLYTTKLVGGTSFAGFANYSQTFETGGYWSGVIRVIIFGAIQIPVMLFIAFFFATMFDLGVIKFGRILRTIFFIPFAVPAVVGAVMWSFLLDPTTGPFTHLANALGFTNTDFFSNNLILPSIIVIVIWEWTGYNMIILYSALKAVPRETVESAVLDGAGLRQIVLQVKLPIVRPAIVLLVFLNTIGALQLFTEPLILSYFQNSSVTDNFTPVLYIYNTAIGGGEYNYGAAAAVVFAVVIILISVGSLVFRGRGGSRQR